MRRPLRLTTSVVLASSMVLAGLGAQTPGTQSRGAAPSKGLIVGRVLDAVSGAPIASVIVSMSGAPLTSSIRVLTDAKGQFLFRNVPTGSFTLRATTGAPQLQGGGFMPGGPGPQVGPYLAGGHGQRRPGGLLQSIDLAEGEQIADAVITLWKGGSIDGTIRDEAGEPLVDVYVAAARRSSDGRLLNGPAVRTDDRGAYHLGALIPGDYVIVVPQMQAAIPADTSDTLAATTNQPLRAILANSGAQAFTGGIAHGAYLLGTPTPPNVNVLPPVPRGDALHIYQTTFAPAATSLSAATSVKVGPGEAHTGIDVSIHPVRAVVVSGTVTDDFGPVPNFGVRLYTREDDPGAIAFDIGYTSTDARGRFTFPLVPPGRYRALAQRYATTRFGPDVVVPATPPRAAERFGASAQQEITVGDQDVREIALHLQRGVAVSGRVQFRGSGKRPPADVVRQLLVFVSPIELASRSFFPRSLSAGVDLKDNFTIRDVVPGRYVMTVNESAGVSLLDVSIDGKSVTERPIEIGTTALSGITIELTDRPAEVTGTVRSRAGAPDANAGVVLFPTDRTRWANVRSGARIFRSARASKTGTFSLRPVLPGEYFIAAIGDDATADFPEPKFLEALAAVATTVRVGPGETANLTLATVDAPAVRSPAPLSLDHSAAVSANETTARGPFADPTTDAVQAQSPPVVVGLSGVVTTADTPARPLRHAIVTATGAESPGPRQAVTDDEGRFSFANLRPGRYTFVVEKPGYVKTFYGSTRPGGTPGTPVAVLTGQPAPHLAIRVPRGAVIAGTVRDQFGMPISGAQVSVKHAVVVKGRRQMADVPNLRVPVVTTDDQGRYRIYGLPPGEYTVFCSIPGITYSGVTETNSADVDAILRELRAGRSVPAASAMPPRRVSLSGGYLPGVPDADGAQLIPLGIGEEFAGADILIGPLRALSVSGTSLGPGGRPMRNIMIAVVNTATGTRIGSGGVIMPGPDGRFVLSALPPGRYTLMGRAAENGAGETDDMPYFAETEFILTDENISGVVLQFERGITVTGRIVPPAGADATDVADVRLGAVPVDSFASLVPARVIATTRRDGTFVFDGVGPGTWRITGASLPSGWSLRSAELGGRDTLDVPFEVHLGQPIAGLTVRMTDQPTEITGTLLDASGRPTSEYAMVAFSADRSHWTTAPRRVSGAARVSSDGRYRIGGLPPGEYYLAVITDVTPGQLDDPSFLESLIPRSVKVVIGEAERKVQDYRIR